MVGAIAGERSPFAGKAAWFTDLAVPAKRGSPSMAVGSREGSPEAGMASTRESERGKQHWIVWALWAGGIGLLVVEMSAGMDYVQASLKQQMVDFLDGVPALGVLALHFAQKAFWAYGNVENALRLMPVVTLPFVLLGVGLALGKHTAR
jgi:hypothetical protein